MNAQNNVFTISSPAFENYSPIPVKYCNKGVNGGENISIPFNWKYPPEGTKSFMLVIVDTHQIANNFIHWVVKDISPDVDSLPEGASNTDLMPEGSQELNSTYGIKGYHGPQPPEGSGKHPYETHFFALDESSIDLSIQPSWQNIREAVSNITINKAFYTGYFSR